jgi:hypothetical protein
MNYPKLTCAPDPPPTCSTVNGVTTCLGPPIKCQAFCVEPGVCTVTCCAAFAPAPVPVGGPVMVGLMVATIAIAVWCWLRKRGQ